MEDLKALYYGTLWGVRRSIRYHGHRRQFFERFNLVTNAVSVIFGSSTILAVLHQVSSQALSSSQSPPWIGVGTAAIVTIFSSLNLVIQTTKMAQMHHDLARRFLELEKEFIKVLPSDGTVKKLAGKRLEIEADEPPILRIVDVLCHNELMRAEGYDQDRFVDHYYKVSPMQRFFSPFFDLGADKIRPICPKHSEC